MHSWTIKTFNSLGKTFLVLEIFCLPTVIPIITAVDIVTGANYYWSLYNCQVIKSKEGPIVFESKVGWMLSRPADNQSISLNISILLSRGMKIQSKFIDTNNLLRDDSK